MNRYIGKICPYCKSIFTGDDTIVVCSDCEMPHHKDCWIENKGCTTFGCLGTIQSIDFEMEAGISSAPKYKIRDDSLEEKLLEQPTFCIRCGSSLNRDSHFCAKCGNPIVVASIRERQSENVQKINEAISKVSSEWKSFIDGFEEDSVLDSELEAYIAVKKEYYLREFVSLNNTKQFTSWNWGAFFLHHFGAYTEKMYIMGGVILGIELLLSLFGEMFIGIISTVLAIFTGLFGNYFYMYFLKQKIDKGRNLRGEQKIQYVEQVGGVNGMIASVVAIIYVLVCVILFV